MDKLSAALNWAARGFRVFPLQENTKKPVHDEWPNLATTNPDQIKSWWRDDLVGIVRGYNIGVDTTGFLVTDLDNKKNKNGQQNFEALGGTFDTLTVRTTTGGYHLYYDAAGLDIANSEGAIAEGVDTRGYHGYVLAPGSTLDGLEYSLVLDKPLADAPSFIWQRVKLASVQKKNINTASIELDTPASISAATQRARDAPAAVEGQGGDAHTYQTACAIRDLGVSEGMAFELLLEHWNPRCYPPWDPDELKAKVGNAYAYAQRSEGEKSPEVLFGGVSIPAPEYTAPAAAVTGAYEFGNLPPLSDLNPRPWVLHRMLLRQEVTALIAPGGVGKSQLILTMGVLLALGVDEVFGFKNVYAGRPLRTLIYDGEDSLEEMAMRIHATCQHMQVDPERVRPHLSLNSGKSARRLKVTKGRDIPAVNHDDVNFLIEKCKQERVDLIALGPLTKLHDSNENDNTCMGYVIDTLEIIARLSNASLLLQHHTAKPTGASSDGFAGSANSARGAKNIVDGVRAAFTLDGISEKDAIDCGISREDREKYLRLDDAKMNRALKSTKATIIFKNSVRLTNGETVGVFTDGNLDQQRNNNARHLAELISLSLKETATMSVADAVSMLRREDPLLAELSDADIKQKVLSTFINGVSLPKGGMVKLQGDGAKRVLALS